MLDHAIHARWGPLHTVLAEDFVIVEPDSLPYGGSYHGVDGYRALMQAIGALFELTFEPVGCHAVGDHMVVLRLNVRFASRSTGLRFACPWSSCSRCGRDALRAARSFCSTPPPCWQL